MEKMDKYELDDLIFQAAFEVFYNNNNWIRYGDLLYQTVEKMRVAIPEIDIDTVEKWIKGCIDAEYISVAKSKYNAEIAADDYCRGEWLGLDKE